MGIVQILTSTTAINEIYAPNSSSTRYTPLSENLVLYHLLVTSGSLNCRSPIDRGSNENNLTVWGCPITVVDGGLHIACFQGLVTVISVHVLVLLACGLRVGTLIKRP